MSCILSINYQGFMSYLREWTSNKSLWYGILSYSSYVNPKFNIQRVDFPWYVVDKLNPVYITTYFYFSMLLFWLLFWLERSLELDWHCTSKVRYSSESLSIAKGESQTLVSYLTWGGLKKNRHLNALWCHILTLTPCSGKIKCLQRHIPREAPLSLILALSVHMKNTHAWHTKSNPIN